MDSFIILSVWRLHDLLLRLQDLLMRLQKITLGEWILVGCIVALLLAFKILIVNPILGWIHRETFL